MANSYLSVMALVLLLNYTGSSGFKSQETGFGIPYNSKCRWDGTFLMNCSFTGKSTTPTDISPTVTVLDLSYNTISVLLWSNWRNEEWNIKHLNLSNNLISEFHLDSFRNLPFLETLNLNGNVIHYVVLDICKSEDWSEKHRKVYTYGLLPFLKVLAIERNNLSAIPRGLGMLQSLRSVHLSSNEILQIEQNDFHNCSQLKNIYLQNNKITKIHPDAFKNLKKLQVLDLSNNVMTTILPEMFIELNIFHLEVDLSNNPWICDCRLMHFKQFISFISASLREKLNILCSEPISTLGKTLLSLTSLDLNCEMLVDDNVSLKKTIIEIGETSVLHCGVDETWGKEEVYWWTPGGRISKDNWLPHIKQNEINNLVIYNVGKSAEGLYVCIFNKTKKYLIYDVEVKQKLSPFLVRNIRDINAVFRQGRTEQDFTLAVCLSVFITFVCAFCLGALSRPYISPLWRQMCRNKSSTSENTYCNQSFSAETLTRENNKTAPTKAWHNSSFLTGSSSEYVGSSSLHDVALHNRVEEERNQDQSSNSIKINKQKMSPHSQATDSASEADIVTDNEHFSLRSDHQNSKNANPSRSTSSDISSHGLKYSINGDSCFTGGNNFPSSLAQIHVNGQIPGSSDVNKSFDLLHSEFAASMLDSPRLREVMSHAESLTMQQFKPQKHNYDTVLDINDNMNVFSDEDLILPNSYKNDVYENFNTWQVQGNSCASIPGYRSNIKTSNKNKPVDICSDSTSTDEGSEFTLSDCNSLAECEFEQSDIGNDHITSQPGLEKVCLNTGTEKFSTLLRSPSISSGFKDAMEEHKNQNKECSETVITSDSDTDMSETNPFALQLNASQVDESSSHIILSDLNLDGLPIYETPDLFKSEYVTSSHSAIQNMSSNSFCKYNTSFDDAVLSLKYSPRSAGKEDSISNATDLQLDQSSALTLQFDKPDQKDETEINMEENQVAQCSSLKNYSKDNFTLNMADVNAPHMSNNFTFTCMDLGSDRVTKKVLSPQSNLAVDEFSLQSHSESTHEKPAPKITERQNLLVQQQQLMNISETRAQRMQKGFDEYKDEQFLSGISKENSSPYQTELQLHNSMADSSHISSSKTMHSFFDGERCLQLDQGKGNACSSSHTQSFLKENLQHSLCEVPKHAEGDTISKRTDSKENGNEALADLENLQMAADLRKSSEKPDQANKTSLGQGTFFVKKKRVFDSFANVLESRKTRDCTN
ncbi:leucine-rich repeat-containing protein 66 isoform X1 [Alligator sinensis]|uniref:Leucine-rich repeat-containing protein 66 isoform X1 n=1 Tax=Alligator sinensis TaxID=38654 RepID=A0A1U7RJA5_ALLSI|nr:leucine-rich repeat-containing protein 66 isoform X1 [Alligator sinensis]